MINQRRHRRVPITGTVTLTFKDKGELRSIQALPCSISLQGLGVYADEPIKDDTSISVSIQFLSFDGMKTESLEGRVVYNRNIGDIDFMGIQFQEEITSENHYLLYEHMQKIIASDK